jgi:hypothetical protein
LNSGKMANSGSMTGSAVCVRLLVGGTFKD